MFIHFSLITSSVVWWASAFSPVTPSLRSTRFAQNANQLEVVKNYPRTSVILRSTRAHSPTDFYLSFYDKIQEIYKYNQDEDSSALNSKSFLLMIPNGVAIDLQRFLDRPPKSPFDPQGDLTTTEEFAAIVDDQYDIDGRPDEGKSIDKLYGSIISGVNCNREPDDRAKDVLAQVHDYLFDEIPPRVVFGVEQPAELTDSAEYAGYKKALRDYDDAMTEYQAVYNSFDLTEREDQRAWLLAQIPLKRAIRDANDKLGRYNMVKQALAYQVSFGNDAVSYTIERAKRLYETSAIDSQVGDRTNYHIGYGTPSNFYDPSVSTAEFTMDSSETTTQHSRESTTFGGGARVRFGWWSIGGGASHTDTREELDIESENVKISFDLCTVLINRPWMDTTLFKLDGWSLKDHPRNSISDGTSIDLDDKLLPYISTALVIAKDVEIKGDWSDYEWEKLTSCTRASASVGFGPFRVKGRYEKQKSDTFESDMEQKGTVKIPGAQVIGLIMAKIPACPPLGDNGPH